MPQVGLETTISAFERAKTVHALDRAVTVIGLLSIVDYLSEYLQVFCACLERNSREVATYLSERKNVSKKGYRE
jgi:hypothetical protein